MKVGTGYTGRPIFTFTTTTTTTTITSLDG